MVAIQYPTPQHCWFFHTVYILPYSHQSVLTLKTTVSMMPMWLFTTWIFDAKYEHVNIHSVAFKQHHLSLDQRQDLFNAISKHKKFIGSLGVYPHKKVQIGLKPWAKPVHHCTYHVPHIHWQTSRNKLITPLSLISSDLVGPLNGNSLPSLFQKSMGGFDKSLTYIQLTKICGIFFITTRKAIKPIFSYHPPICLK